jgi:cytochrome c
VRRALVVLLLGAGACQAKEAHQPLPEGPFGLGRTPTEEEVTAWNTSVNPTGKNLPPGQGSVAEGKVVFAAKCAVCHGDAGQGMPPTYPQLVGKEPADFSFDDDFKKAHTIGNYWPYATTLYDYIRRAMPLTAPGTLNADQTYAVTAYLLNREGIVPAGTPLDAKSLTAIVMPARDHFVPDDRRGSSGGKNVR